MCTFCTNPCPDGIKNAHHDTSVELLTNSANTVWKENADVESRKKTGSLNDNVADGGVIKSLPGRCALGIADPCQDDALVEVYTVVGDIAGCNVSQRNATTQLYHLQ